MTNTTLYTVYCIYYLPIHSSGTSIIFGQKRKCPDFRGYIVYKLDVVDSEMGLEVSLFQGDLIRGFDVKLLLGNRYYVFRRALVTNTDP